MSRDFLLYTKKETSRVLFYNKNMAVTFTSSKSYERKYKLKTEGIRITLYLNIYLFVYVL